MKKFTGWKKILGDSLYLEDGIVKRGVSRCSDRTTYPYRVCKDGGWDQDQDMTESAYRAAVKRGTVVMM